MALGIPGIGGDAADIVFSIKIDGNPLPPEFGLISLVVERTFNKIAAAQLVVQDDDTGDEPYPFSIGNFSMPGTEVEIAAGYDHSTDILFKGIIVSQRMKINKSRSVVVLECRDKSIGMTMVKKSAYYYDMKDSEICSQLIGDAGLSANVAATTVQHAEMVQYHTTNWDFMLSRAEANGLLVSTVDGVIHCMKPPASGAPVLKATYGENVFEFDSLMDARTQLKNVEASAWDMAARQLSVSVSSEPSLVNNGNLSGTNLAAAVSNETYSVVHSGNLATDELKSFADATLIKSRLARMQGRVSVAGTGLVKPGDIITLEGFGARYNGDVIVTAVRHDLSQGNWLTDIQFGLSGKWHVVDKAISETPAAGMLPSIQGLQIGVVTALETDPDGENRIKVKIPVIGAGEEGTWARQASADAGNARGWVIRPEIGDEVIVGFINSDPRDAVVLGALHSSNNAAPINASDDNHEKGWVTRSGIKLLVNDDKKTMELSTPAGNTIRMDEDAKIVSITDQNNNSIEMSSNGITIESSKNIVLKASGDIQLEGMNIQQKASVAFTGEGSASATLKSSGTVTVKGSTVMIN